MTVRGVPAPQLYSPSLYWEDRARRFAAEGDGLAAVCAYGMPEFYNRGIHLEQRLALEPWLKAGAGTRVLDVGCGVGRWSRLLAARGADVLGVDLSPTMIAQARRRAVAEGVGDRCRFRVQDVSNLDVGERFDLILGVTVLQHILDPVALRAALAACGVRTGSEESGRVTMEIRRRSMAAVGVFVLLGVVVALGHWYETQRARAQPLPLRPTQKTVLVHVTNAGDRGPGTLREALFVVATATGPTSISIEVPKIDLETALPAFVNGHGVKLLGQAPGAQIDAQALGAGAVFDVSGPNTSIDGIMIRNCSGAAILVRTVRFRLSASTIDSCDVAVEVAENASDILLERNHFVKDRLGVRFGAAAHNSAVVNNEFVKTKDAGIWAVRGAPDSHDDVIGIHDNKFTEDGIGIVAGNISVLVERNDFINARGADVHLVGAGAVIRANRIHGGASMGIVAENARGAVIDDNEMEGLAAYGVRVRGASNQLGRGKRGDHSRYVYPCVVGGAPRRRDCGTAS